jgi:predicted site-specific integrase-resolvase
VSTANEAQKTSYENQKTRLIQRITDEKRETQELREYGDIASSMSARPSLFRLIDDVLDAKIQTIFITCADRLARDPAQKALILHLCKRMGVSIVEIDPTEDDPLDRDGDLADLLSYLTVWCNRKSGRKAGLLRQKTLSEETIATIFALHQRGHTIAEITAKLAEAGHRCVKPEGARIGTHSVWKTLQSKPLRQVENAPKATEELLRQFIAEHYQIDPKGFIAVGELFKHFQAYCRAKGNRITWKEWVRVGARSMVAMGVQRKRDKGRGYGLLPRIKIKGGRSKALDRPKINI